LTTLSHRACAASQTLRETIKAEVARHKDLKARPGGQQRALLALKHASIMKKELDEALQAAAP
jgi:hypothetical protein